MPMWDVTAFSVKKEGWDDVGENPRHKLSGLHSLAHNP